MKVRNKEISWLAFNARLLQEACDATVPLIERIKFLGIFSSNLDEFFRVRVATLKRLTRLGKRARQLIGHDPVKVLKEIHRVVLAQQKEFDRIYQQIIRELEREHIFITDETRLDEEQSRFVANHFRTRVRPALVPLMVDQVKEIPQLKDHAIYLAVMMSYADKKKGCRYALIEVPSSVNRFVILPQSGRNHYIMLVDDVIRHSLGSIFSMFEFDNFSAYTIKLTRDAELDMDDDFSESYVDKMYDSLKKRKEGKPVRFIFDSQMPGEFLTFLLRKLKVNRRDSDLIPGSRYHNFKDFMKFPQVGSKKLVSTPFTPLQHPDIGENSSILQAIEKRDVLLTYPFQTFDYVLDLLREAAIDPDVIRIKITLYRVASDSNVINALINAARNGKSVAVVMELQARFDEEANIYWSNKLRDEGVKVIHGIPGLKVHAKLILITRKAGRRKIHYVCAGTGNFNEATARVYGDHSLFTSDARITGEVVKIFDFLESSYKVDTFRHLFVSPFSMRKKLTALVNQEVEIARQGGKGLIFLKMNNLTDPRMIKRLYKAAAAGVEVRLMVRGMFSVYTGLEELKGNIQATGIVDRYLEHSRLLVFGNAGDPQVFLTSADWMPRNLDKRVEVVCPVYDPQLRDALLDYMNIQWSDNQKSRVLDDDLSNRFRPEKNSKPVQSQVELYHYFDEKLKAKSTAKIKDKARKAG